MLSIQPMKGTASNAKDIENWQFHSLHFGCTVRVANWATTNQAPLIKHCFVCDRNDNSTTERCYNFIGCSGSHSQRRNWWYWNSWNSLICASMRNAHTLIWNEQSARCKPFQNKFIWFWLNGGRFVCAYVKKEGSAFLPPFGCAHRDGEGRWHVKRCRNLSIDRTTRENQ